MVSHYLCSIALWERKRSIVIPLGVLCLAHWALLYRTMFVVIAVWDESRKACIVTATNPSLLNTTFFFSASPGHLCLAVPLMTSAVVLAMGFDLIILVFTTAALLARHSARTDLWKLLFQDGLVYFLVSFSTNCIPAVCDDLLYSAELHP